MSFMLTTRQISRRQKTVTRRDAGTWKSLKKGDQIRACAKCQGLRPGEQISQLAVIRIVDVRVERLDQITDEDVLREGFPGMTSEEFMRMYCHAMSCQPTHLVRRIEFEYV
jgi:hypothetical protein